MLILYRSRSEPVVLQGFQRDGAEGEMVQAEWNHIACGSGHTVGVTPAGDVYSWGLNGRGQLGYGNSVRNTKEPKLVPVTIFNGKKVIEVSCGHWHTVVVTSEGGLYTWYV